MHWLGQQREMQVWREFWAQVWRRPASSSMFPLAFLCFCYGHEKVMASMVRLAPGPRTVSDIWSKAPGHLTDTNHVQPQSVEPLRNIRNKCSSLYVIEVLWLSQNSFVAIADWYTHGSYCTLSITPLISSTIFMFFLFKSLPGIPHHPFLLFFQEDHNHPKKQEGKAINRILIFITVNSSEGSLWYKKALPVLHLVRQFHFPQLLPEKTDMIRTEYITCMWKEVRCQTKTLSLCFTHSLFVRLGLGNIKGYSVIETINK